MDTTAVMAQDKASRWAHQYSETDLKNMQELAGTKDVGELYRGLTGHRDPWPVWFVKQNPATRLKILRRLNNRGRSGKRKRYYPRSSYGGYRRSYGRRRYVRGRGPYYVSGGLDIPGVGSLRGGGYSEGFDKGAISGLGPYVVKKNSLVGDIDINTEPPIIRNSRSGEAVIIQHREYIKDITSGEAGTPTEFKLEKWDINPGNPKLFPWLSTIAQNFQEYELRGMIAMVKTMSTDYSSTVQLGTIFGATDYNLHNADPSNKQQVEMLEYANSCKPSRSLVLPIECEGANNGDTHKYIAINRDYNGGDPNLYDWGNLFIGSQGLPQADAPIGEFWITYEVALFKPILKQNLMDAFKHCVAAKFVARNCSNTNTWGTVQSEGGDPEIAWQLSGNVLECRLPQISDDYIVGISYLCRTAAPTAAVLLHGTIGWVTDFAGQGQPLDWDCMADSPIGFLNHFNIDNTQGWAVQEYYEIHEGDARTISISNALANFQGRSDASITVIVQMFNKTLCGNMIPQF